jgi:cob(I)alamin adenosyltransferase
VELRQFGRAEFVDRNNPDPADIRMAHDALQTAADAMARGECDILILDEVNVALDFGLITLDEILRLLDAKPPTIELVLTGRNAHPEIVRRADLVTEMLDIKHPYAEGVQARRGIEY